MLQKIYQIFSIIMNLLLATLISSLIATMMVLMFYMLFIAPSGLIPSVPMAIRILVYILAKVVLIHTTYMLYKHEQRLGKRVN